MNDRSAVWAIHFTIVMFPPTMSFASTAKHIIHQNDQADGHDGNDEYVFFTGQLLNCLLFTRLLLMQAIWLKIIFPLAKNPLWSIPFFRTIFFRIPG